MYIPFNQMPADARVWIYQSSESLSGEMQERLLVSLQNFIESWDSHGRSLKASAQIRHNHFIIIALDERVIPASGCAIDKSVHFLQGLESNTGIKLFDRSLQAFLIDDQVQFVEVKNLKKAVETGQIEADTITFNNLISTAGQLQTEWQVPAAKSWLARYFRKQPQL